LDSGKKDPRYTPFFLPAVPLFRSSCIRKKKPHYLHCAPGSRPRPPMPPASCLHSWPGSVFEFSSNPSPRASPILTLRGDARERLTVVSAFPCRARPPAFSSLAKSGLVLHEMGQCVAALMHDRTRLYIFACLQCCGTGEPAGPPSRRLCLRLSGMIGIHINLMMAPSRDPHRLFPQFRPRRNSGTLARTLRTGTPRETGYQ